MLELYVPLRWGDQFAAVHLATCYSSFESVVHAFQSVLEQLSAHFQADELSKGKHP
jgi:transcriptional regulator NrdR family protein